MFLYSGQFFMHSLALFQLNYATFYFTLKRESDLMSLMKAMCARLLTRFKVSHALQLPKKNLRCTAMRVKRLQEEGKKEKGSSYNINIFKIMSLL
jgi:hypothetical protein